VRVGVKRRVRWALVALAAGSASFMMSGTPATAAGEMAPVDVVEVSGLVDEIVADSIEEALQRSATNGSQAVILQVNSKGAIVDRDRMTDLLTAIANAKVPVAVWVGPSGSRALGLPAQMLAVADVSAMAPGTRVGRTGTLLEVAGEQISFGAASAVLRAGTLGFEEAREQGVLKFSNDDRGVPVLRNMLLALDGVEARGAVLNTVTDSVDDDGQVVLEATTARFFKLGFVPRVLHTVSSPASAYLLVTIGLALLLFEFFTAGIGVAGLVGAVSLVLGSLGLGALPISGVGLALLLLAMIAFAVDVQVGIPRFWTGVGMVLYVVSSFTLFESTDGLTMRPSWITLSTGIIGIALTFVVGMPSMVRTRFGTPTIGRDSLVGATGTAVGEISPDGIALVSGAQWRARTNRATPLADRAELRVTGIDGVTLEVEPIEGGARDYREMREKR
jgi:membrane-bound serine protease (ClpP class)